MPDSAPILVVGATGRLGGQVVDQLLARGKSVRALVRPTTDASHLAGAAVSIARGDLLDEDSLVAAMTGIDAVISTAAGYTRRSPTALQTDTVGQANLAKAAARTGVRRVVLTSILTCDQTPQVPHFWNKKLAEDALRDNAVPYVALRPGAFLDQIVRMGGDLFAKGTFMWMGAPNIPLTFVLTPDLAGYLAAAVDAPDVEGQHIDIGWDRPVTAEEVATIAGAITNTPFTVTAPPPALMASSTPSQAGDAATADMAAMMAWFATGKYVSDTTRQAQTFGPPPTAEDAIARLLATLSTATL